MKVDKVENSWHSKASTLKVHRIIKVISKKYCQLQENLPLFYFEILPSNHCPNKRQFANYSIRKPIEDAEQAGYDCSALSGTSQLVDVKLLEKVNFSYPVVKCLGFNNQYHVYLSSLLSATGVFQPEMAYQ